ncbi:MAG TPA: 3-dehydroquinate synthase [Chloroflexota bacterium]|nr:3-dehydroquinate synthase [Chloroflexota bacterium]
MATVIADSLHVEPGVAGRLGELLRRRGLEGRAFVVTDDRVGALHGRLVVGSLAATGYEPVLKAVPNVEASKSLRTATELYCWLAAERAERRDFVVALGGGLVGDLAGFVAATYLRGLPVVQVPTTLLAQVDSAIGGKTGVNLEVGKNLVGAWHMPHTIALDPTLLSTLPEREIRAGWVETIKHALLFDEELLRRVEDDAAALLRLAPEQTAGVVERSAGLKVAVVEEDPREQGRRIVLNYGHTIGHALEAATDYRRFLHGEAIAVGLVGAARIGVALGVTPEGLAERQRGLLEGFGLSLRAPGVDPARVLSAVKLDKKVTRRAVRWVLLEAVGRPVVRHDVPPELVDAVVRELM